MSEKRVLTVKCPCGVSLQVKTRSVEKQVTCPKCGASMAVSAAAAPAELPFAAMIEEPPASLPMAEPLAALPMAEPLTLPFAQPLTASRRWSPRQLAISGSIGGGVLVAAVLLLVLRPGAGPTGPSSPSISGNSTQTGGPAVEPVISQQASLAGQAQEDGQQDAEGAVQTEGEAAVADQGFSTPKSKQKKGANNSSHPGGDFSEALSKVKNKQILNNPSNTGGNSFAGGGFQSLNQTPRDQQRNWDLANGGRLGAMGLKKVQVPRR